MRGYDCHGFLFNRRVAAVEEQTRYVVQVILN